MKLRKALDKMGNSQAEDDDGFAIVKAVIKEHFISLTYMDGF